MPKGDHISRFFLPPELKFISSTRHKSGHKWQVVKVRQPFEICPKCTTPSNIRCGKAYSTVREESIQGSPLWLRIQKHRYFCTSCKKPFTEHVLGIVPRRKTTQRFRRSLLKGCINYVNLSKVKNDFKCSSGLIYKVFYEQAEVKLRERKGVQWPKRIGIDEHFFSRRKGYCEFATVISNLDKGKLFELAYGKQNKNLIEQLKDIPGRENVQVVAIDMSDSYRSFVKAFFPNAKIVADKFHVLRLPTPTIIKHRKNIHGHKQNLRTRRLLLKNRMSLDYDVRCELDRYLTQYPDLNELYRAKEKLYEFYRTKGLNRAVQSFHRLIEQMSKSNLPELNKLKNTLIKWKHEILRYFERGVTNALSEAINNSAKRLQRRACGYKSFKNYRLAVLSACAF